MLAALNGVMGERLLAGNKPLATSMTLHCQGEALDWQALPPGLAVTGKVLLLIHGLSMNDLQWRTWHAAGPAQDMGHGAALAAQLGCTPVYLRYHTGLHISQNGHELSSQLEQLVMHWPVPVRELTVVAHCMGGLVIRSAVHYGRQGASRWPARLNNMVFLGTPHHGAPLEPAGNWIDVILGRAPLSGPFIRPARSRSAGISDLRYGHMLDIDWLGQDRFRPRTESREAVPLPEGVACYTVAATTAGKRGTLADHLVGDGLVPLNSALGQHDDSRRSLAFAKTSQWIAYHTSHMALVSSRTVAQQLVRWLAPGSTRP